MKGKLIFYMLDGTQIEMVEEKAKDISFLFNRRKMEDRYTFQVDFKFNSIQEDIEKRIFNFYNQSLKNAGVDYVELYLSNEEIEENEYTLIYTSHPFGFQVYSIKYSEGYNKNETSFVETLTMEFIEV